MAAAGEARYDEIAMRRRYVVERIVNCESLIECCSKFNGRSAKSGKSYGV